MAQRLYLTEIARDFVGDADFPAFTTDAWREVSRTKGGADFDFVTYEKIG